MSRPSPRFAPPTPPAICPAAASQHSLACGKRSLTSSKPRSKRCVSFGSRFVGECMAQESCTGAIFTGLCPGQDYCCVPETQRAENRGTFIRSERLDKIVRAVNVPRRQLPARTEALWPYINEALAGMDGLSCHCAAAFLAVIAAETDRFRLFEEKGSTAYFEGKAYGHRWKGRGAIHITWEANYKSASDVLGYDYVANPELLAFPAHAFKVSVHWWIASLRCSRHPS